MPSQDTVEFVANLIQATIADQSMSRWEKVKFILWVFYVTAPQTPRVVF